MHSNLKIFQDIFGRKIYNFKTFTKLTRFGVDSLALEEVVNSRGLERYFYLIQSHRC